VKILKKGIRMKIVVDAFGGDYAPQEIVAGAVKALQNNEKLEVVLVGDKDIGVVTEVMHMKANDVLRVGEVLIPYVKEFIIKIEDNTIYVKDVGGLI
jgi:fatty acid/phospholipid biosynthesis enzyme